MVEILCENVYILMGKMFSKEKVMKNDEKRLQKNEKIHEKPNL